MKEVNEYIVKRRKRRRRKRMVIFFLILICVLVTLCLKLPYFNIKYITVEGNKIIKSDNIIENSGLTKGNNIFYLNLNKYKDNILQNPYIKDVSVKQKLPNTIDIIVKERQSVFYINKDSNYFIIDKNGVLLEIRNNISGMNLIKLDGVNLKSNKLGNKIPCDSRRLDVINKITSISINDSKLKITDVDMSNILNLKVYFKDMCVVIGTPDDIYNKINEAVNVISSQKLNDKKGYVDVSFKGNPVYSVQQ
ncbi:cell division protein FtsQ/DivIB [Clostridium felsineum]|uniref:Cell division protein DivIB n=1 Tax=Clostridium felsineum TaxID=36839 RepID=A0A1S8L0C8_9CLOT|nr:cell division protein FtsQ/DivIB [Clostridium felsineum]MCR3757859.1 cell division protein FtsQ/DivIB [Clostridium felsineum]URZ00886.1 Cell division protein DivIB [Clostridium felsineum]URZ06368.1 Cell division protein DivIB [Clostridium felsineum]URZ11403.1 Cell division protein DivIB [Clostridium felsineum]URZ16064.1 Cell division protein DivIB [Clostridium felsineum DSM 794]